MSTVVVLYDGFSRMSRNEEMIANCSCSLVTGEHNIIVDTMTAWDSEKIRQALQNNNITPAMINYVVSTHGHSDHIGNNNLFLKAKHIVGFSISFQENYFLHAFDKGEKYVINSSVEIIPTPGHTLSDVTVLVKNILGETVAITGDLFERYEDIENPEVWMEACSEDPLQQRKNRSLVADMANWIVPGHGPMFKVTEHIKTLLRKQMPNSA